MYVISRGQVEVLDELGRVLKTLGDGEIFGEIALILERPRTATVRAVGDCDLFVLTQTDFAKILRENPQFTARIRSIADSRYAITAEVDKHLNTWSDPDVAL